MKMLEAKPFDQNAENWKQENRLLSLTMLTAGASGQNRIGTNELRSHRTVWFVFGAQNLVSRQKLALVVTEGFYSPNETRTWEITTKTAVFRHRWQAWKVVWSITAVRQRPRMPWNWRCSFAFFVSFLRYFNEKQKKKAAEVIFRSSRPSLCQNQENGAGKQWSLHAPHRRTHPEDESFKPVPSKHAFSSGGAYWTN